MKDGFEAGHPMRTKVEPWWEQIVVPKAPPQRCALTRKPVGKSRAQIAHEARNAQRHEEALRRRAAKQRAERPSTPRPDKEAFRQYLIANPTAAEALLATQLGARGVPFRFQPLIQGYIPDFRIVPSRVLVELDGGVHEGREAEDERRDSHLRRRGWRILRFRNAEVFGDPGAVVRAILHATKGSPIGP